MSAPPTPSPSHYGPWNPGLKSQIPRELRPLSTILRPANVFTACAAAEELQSLTGFNLVELIAFRPQRLALHELLIRITADFVVPDGPKIEDLGINFRNIAGRVLRTQIEPHADYIEEIFADVQRRVSASTEKALGEAVPAFAASPEVSRRPWQHWRARLHRAPPKLRQTDWGPGEIEACAQAAARSFDPLERLVRHTLARVLAALFAAHGQAWGTRELIVGVVRDMVCNEFASDVIGAAIEPLIESAGLGEGLARLPPQERPVVINTKGPSASGKSTLRPLQKRLAGAIGVDWRDFALISPDIWRKQLLDYASLGDAYRYAGAFTADELQIIDQKLDRYMARKYRDGGMTHLLIDRFRFDSFAPDSHEAGSNFLTRFGETVYLFFVITPPEMLVERAWTRGLEVGRYKAVDDTLAHAVEAYTGIPNVFFTWIQRSDKRIRFEFLDNTVPLGAVPRTVAFGDNDTIHLLDLSRMLDIDRYGRISIEARSAAQLQPDQRLLAPERNIAFLERCVRGFRRVRFALQASGQIYLELESGLPTRWDAQALERARCDPDTAAALRVLVPSLASKPPPMAPIPWFIARDGWATLGAWGEEGGQAPSNESPSGRLDQPRKSQWRST